MVPTNSLYRTKIGYVEQQYLKKYKEAEQDYRKAIELNLADAEAHYRLGMLLIEKFGQRRGGEQELRTAYEQNSGDAEIKAAYERFVH